MIALRTVWLVLGCLVLLGCQPAPVPEPPLVTPLPVMASVAVGVTDGATELLPVLEAAGQIRPNLTLNLPVTADQPLLADLDDRTLDAVLIHHLPSYRDDLWFNPVALDGIVLIVHPDNRLQSLTMAQVQGLFAGSIETWASLGAQGEVVLIGQDAASGARALLEQFVLRERRLSINAQIRPNASAVIAAVAADPAAIGFVTAGSLPETAAVKLLAIDNIAPTPITLGTQEYPLSLPLYWVSRSEPQDALRGLLGYLQSSDGQVELGAVFGRIR